MAEVRIPTFDELLLSLAMATEHPNDTCWDIYRYMNAHVGDGTLSSEEARTLLSSYMKLPKTQPSLLHSRMLYVALKMTEVYPDFRLPAFLDLWGFPEMLRDEDKEPQVGKDGKKYLALKVKTERALQTYLLHHPAERTAEGNDGILPMIATKVFQTERDGRKVRSVKLVGPHGEELLADSHVFKCKPWEIQGRMFDVITRVSRGGNERAQEIVASQTNVADVFPVIVGYVDRVDAEHGHFHVYDSLSRHFVAEKPAVQLQKGDFVKFSPVIPAKDKFKSALIHAVLPVSEGTETFGMLKATVTYVDKAKGFFAYRLDDIPPTTDEGIITPEGTADLSLCPTVEKNTVLRLLLFLTRGNEGVKRNHVAMALEG